MKSRDFVGTEDVAAICEAVSDWDFFSDSMDWWKRNLQEPKKLSVHVNTSNFPALYITVQLSNRTIQWFSDYFWILLTIISLTYLPLICRSLHKDMKQRLIGKPQMAISGQFTKGSLVNSWMVGKGNYPTTDYYILSYTIYILWFTTTSVPVHDNVSLYTLYIYPWYIPCLYYIYTHTLIHLYPLPDVPTPPTHTGRRSNITICIPLDL